jgi:hypothetical protein
MRIDLEISSKNGLSVMAGVCVVLLAIIPLKVDSAHLDWLRWQIAIYAAAALAIFSLIAQAFIQSKEDRKRDLREIERDKRQDGIESQLAELSSQLKAGTPKPTITEGAVALEKPAPAPAQAPEAPPDITGEVYRLVMSPRSVAWPIVRDIFKIKGKPDEAAVDTDVLVDMYLVNQNLHNPQYIKELLLTAEVNGKRVDFHRQDDFRADPFADREFEYGLKREGTSGDDEEPLKPLFSSMPATLQPQQPADGWVRFMAKEINPDKIVSGTIALTVVNSLGKEFTITKASTDKRDDGEIGLRPIRP